DDGRMKMKKGKIGVVVMTMMILGMLNWYTFTYDEGLSDGVLEVQARVLSVDNSDVMTNGVSSIGFQSVELQLLNKGYKGMVMSATNQLNGQVDYDEIYVAGDRIIVALQLKQGQIIKVRTVDFYRQTWLAWLFLFFVVVLLIYAKIIGLKALLSFVLSLFVLWEVLVKGLLAGQEPLLLTGMTVVLLSAGIIFLVTGISRRGMAAFLGTLVGLMVTLLFTILFGLKMRLLGLTQPYVQTLFISGYHNLNFREIFYSAIILGASGAAMDIAVDISASIHEIKVQNPDIATKVLIQSGFNVGRQVIGTMATTLLLAYSGSYLTLLMMFVAKDTSLVRMLNLKLVSGEIMRTVIGSIGLVLVAPSTALFAGVLENVTLTKIIEKGEELVEME
ncbi:MAG: YibE/F family protein, partial [Clostridia bacterium]|nr:YibE/F family protein [Clostridia bacterium]